MVAMDRKHAHQAQPDTLGQTAAKRHENNMACSQKRKFAGGIMSSFKRRVNRNRGKFGRHNYQRPLLDFAQRLNPEPGKVIHISVYHDRWCAIYKGGDCNCTPEIREGATQQN
jgi:hypothetical protein